WCRINVVAGELVRTVRSGHCLRACADPVAPDLLSQLVRRHAPAVGVDLAPGRLVGTDRPEVGRLVSAAGDLHAETRAALGVAAVAAGAMERPGRRANCLAAGGCARSPS